MTCLRLRGLSLRVATHGAIAVMFIVRSTDGGCKLMVSSPTHGAIAVMFIGLCGRVATHGAIAVMFIKPQASPAVLAA